MYSIPICIILFTVFYQKVGTFPPQDASAKRNENIPEEKLSNKNPVIINLKHFDNEKQSLQIQPQNLTAINSGNGSQITNYYGSPDINTTTLNHTKGPNIKVNAKVDETFEEATDIESGAVTRGILVVLGISCLFILYVGIKTYRRKKQDKSKLILKRYGIRTHRSDIEMEPLPLSDEEDETVFDLTASRTT